jgi:hypothetical protein
MHGDHHRNRRRVARRMMMKRHFGMTAAMGRGPCFDHDDYDEGWGPTVDQKVRWLEEYQRDLEQETADVASRIADLRATAGSPTE